MKVYRWVETEDHWIAVVRPDELFYLDEIDLSEFPDIGESYIVGRHRLRGGIETFAYAFGKRKFFENIVRRMMDRIPDRFLESDRESLASLAKKSHLKKTS